MQSVAVCCGVLQCVAVCCGVLRCVAVCVAAVTALYCCQQLLYLLQHTRTMYSVPSTHSLLLQKKKSNKRLQLQMIFSVPAILLPADEKKNAGAPGTMVKSDREMGTQNTMPLIVIEKRSFRIKCIVSVVKS